MGIKLLICKPCRQCHVGDPVAFAVAVFLLLLLSSWLSKKSGKGNEIILVLMRIKALHMTLQHIAPTIYRV